jgi:hypothetical protein
MRNKKAKAIRKYVRETVDVPQATSYNMGQDVQFFNETDEAVVVHLKRTKGIPRTMKVCARGVCKEMKHEAL